MCRGVFLGGLALAIGSLLDSIGAGQEIPPRLALLNRAVAHLEQAGLSDEAAEVRKWIALENTSSHSCLSAKTEAPSVDKTEQPPCNGCDIALLERKLGDLAALQAEIDQLRAAIGTAPQVVVRLRLLSFHPEKLAELGFSLVSVRHLIEQPGSVLIVAESSHVPGFLDFLEQQRLLHRVAEPTLMASPGREVVFDSRGSAAASHTKFRCLVELGDNDVKLDVRLHHAGVDIQAQTELALGQIAILGGLKQQEEQKQSSDLGVLAILTAELKGSPN